MTHPPGFEQISAELTEAVYLGKVRALGVVIIGEDGNTARMLSSANQGYGFQLVAALEFLKHDLVHKNQMLPGPPPDQD